MQNEFELIKTGLKILIKGIFDYIKKIPAFLFLYGRIYTITVLFALFVSFVLKYFKIPADTTAFIFKSLLLFGQIIPAASYAGAITIDKTIEGSMDICFSGLIISSLLIWYAL